MPKTKTNTKSSVRHRAKHRVPFYQRPLVLAIFVLILIAIALIVIFGFRKQEDAEGSNDAPTVVATEPVSTTPTETAPMSEPEEKTTQYEGEDPNTLQELTGAIARRTVTNGKLTIVATIDQYLQSTGSCTLVVKNAAGKQVYTSTRAAVADVTTSVCEPFEVNNLSSGTYQLIIDLNADGKQGRITEEVTL